MAYANTKLANNSATTKTGDGDGDGKKPKQKPGQTPSQNPPSHPNNAPEKTPKDPKMQVDPATLHRNAFGHNYTYTNNPTNFYGMYDYSTPPVNQVDANSEGHDKFYDANHLRGSYDMAGSFKAIPGDYELIFKDYQAFGAMWSTPTERCQGFAVATSALLIVASKTSVALVYYYATGISPF